MLCQWGLRRQPPHPSAPPGRALRAGLVGVRSSRYVPRDLWPFSKPRAGTGHSDTTDKWSMPYPKLPEHRFGLCRFCQCQASRCQVNHTSSLAAAIIAAMPALIAAGRVGQASISLARQTSVARSSVSTAASTAARDLPLIAVSALTDESSAFVKNRSSVQIRLVAFSQPTVQT